MQVRTFTGFWNMERKIYAIYDIALPFPIPLKVAGVFLVIGVPWFILLSLLHVPFGNPWYLIYLLPPLGLAYGATRPIFQGKTIVQWAFSMARYLGQPKALNGLRNKNFETNTRYRLSSTIFTRDEELLTLRKGNKQ